MQVSVEATQGLERRLTISVPAEQIEKLVKDSLQREAKRARIPGFRPGKVPITVINKRYGAAIRQDIMGEVMQRNFIEAIIAEKLNPAVHRLLFQVQLMAKSSNLSLPLKSIQKLS